MSPSNSLPLEGAPSISGGQPQLLQPQPSAGGSPGPIGWMPRKSAWMPYRAKSPETRKDTQGIDAGETVEPDAPAERQPSIGSRGEAAMSAHHAASAASMPVKTSLDLLHEAAVSAGGKEQSLQTPDATPCTPAAVPASHPAAQGVFLPQGL
jgi:hypothetical protein